MQEARLKPSFLRTILNFGDLSFVLTFNNPLNMDTGLGAIYNQSQYSGFDIEVIDSDNLENNNV